MTRTVSLCVPAEADFARTVRMTAANLAVIMDLDVDEVEDLRIAAEEGFVLACATQPERCEISFVLDQEQDQMSMSFSLGETDPETGDVDLDLVELLLEAVCDEFGVSPDGSTLRLSKSVRYHVG